MTTEAINAALDEAEIIINRLVSLAPAMQEMYRAMNNGEFNGEQLERWTMLLKRIDEANRSIG